MELKLLKTILNLLKYIFIFILIIFIVFYKYYNLSLKQICKQLKNNSIKYLLQKFKDFDNSD